MIVISIIIISLILDGLTTNIMPYLVNDLSVFTTLFTITSLFLIQPFYKKKVKTYYLLCIVLGIIYDSLYANLYLINAALFLLLGIIIKYIYKSFVVDKVSLILYIIIIVIIYEILLATIFYIFNLVPITLFDILYKIINSLLLNIVYAEILYYIITKYTKNHKNPIN